MSEQLRVVRGDDNRGIPGVHRQKSHLGLPVEHEISRMLMSTLTRGFGIVKTLAAKIHLTRDAVIFDSHSPADTVRMKIGPNVVVIRVIAQIPVELAVQHITGIAFFLAPYLLA